MLRRVALAAVAALLATAATAHADVRTATDEGTGLVFTLDGAVLSVAPGPATPPDAVARLQQGAVQVTCQSGLAATLATSGMSPSPTPTTFNLQQLGVPATWVPGTPALQATLPADVSVAADLCSVGPADGSAVATGYFNEAVRAIAREDAAQAGTAQPDTEARTTLSTAYARVQEVAGRKRFMNARRLVARLRADYPKMKVSVARRLADARERGVVYVVRSGTSTHRLLLALPADGGQVYLTRARVAQGKVTVTHGVRPR